MSGSAPAHGLWSLVVVNSLVFIVFAFSLTKPKTPRDGRSSGAFSAFLVALFTKMYGFPLTIYLLSGWLTTQYPGVDWLAHDFGHLPEMIFGWRGQPHLGPFHWISNLLVFGGFMLLASGWNVLYTAQKSRTLASTGPYARIRHPQYVAFMLIMVGFLFQWPTLVTLAMFPVLASMYVRLAKGEEREGLAKYAETYRAYIREVPAFVPRFRAANAPTGPSSVDPEGI